MISSFRYCHFRYNRLILIGLLSCSILLIWRYPSISAREEYGEISRLSGKWSIIDARPASSEGVQIDNKEELIGISLFISPAIIFWSPPMYFLPKKERDCRNPILQGNKSKQLFKFFCEGDFEFGNHSEITLKSTDVMTMTWFDNEILTLKR